MALNIDNNEPIIVHEAGEISWLWLEQNGISEVYINNFKGKFSKSHIYILIVFTYTFQ